jgi:hypothetical protein
LQTPGFTDQERENFGKLMVGGVSAEKLATTLNGKNPPDQNVPGADTQECAFFDVWRKFYPYVPQDDEGEVEGAEKESKDDNEACPYTYWR